MKKDVYVVPHSHWDAEWYFTCEDSEVLLLENWKQLMALLEERDDFPSYCFDGLAMPIDDYLAVRPQERSRVAKLIGDRKLFVGPWYTQTDTLLVRTESVVRNLMYGTSIARELGHCMNIGYLPDIFGQHAYLPSFFKSLGIDYSVLQRGLYTDQIEHDLNFQWESPDGERIPANCLYFGYGPGKFLSADKDYVNHRLLPILDKLAQMNEHTDHLLLPSGGDQVFANPAFPATVEQLNAMDLPYEFHMSSYEDYMADAWADGSFDNVIEGELIACQKSRIHRTCHSTRVDMKQQTYLTEHLMLDLLEPLTAIAHELGIEYPQDLLSHLWKKIFASHAHNGIEASNADQVNRNVISRLRSVERSADAMIGLLKKRITRAVANELGREDILVCFHLDPHAETSAIEAVVFTKNPAFSLLDGDVPVAYQILEQERLSGGQIVVVTAKGEKLQDVDDYYRTRVLLAPLEFDGFGYRTLFVNEGVAESRSSADDNAQESFRIQNEQYAVALVDGGLRLENLGTGTVIENALTFYDDADYGDEFDFAPLEGDDSVWAKPFTPVAVERGTLESSLTCKTSIELSADIEERKAGKRSQVMEIETTVRVRTGEPFVRIEHHLINEARDHRLRARIRTPFGEVFESYADQGYSIISRPCHTTYIDHWRELGFVEKPMPIYTMENAAFLRDAGSTAGVITKGIKEYEIANSDSGSALDLTLYRSVGLLGRDDTAWRPGRASGINNKVVETPDAQMIGSIDLEYALWCSDDMADSNLFRAIDVFRNRTCSYQLQGLNTFQERLERFGLPMPEAGLPAACSLFTFDSSSLFAGVVKVSEGGDTVTVRVFNPTSEEVTFNPSAWADEAWSCGLAEEPGDCIKDGIVIGAKGYATVLLKGVSHEAR